MQDHYKTLGVNSSATLDEIRRAYRILARRYHPDLNPGQENDNKFKAIAAAYGVLSDPKKRESYDMEYDRLQMSRLADKFKSYSNFQHGGRRGGTTFGQTPPESKSGANRQEEKRRKSSQGSWSKLLEKAKERFAWAHGAVKKPAAKPMVKGGPRSVSIIEVSVSIKDAVTGIKKTVEIPEASGARKVSVVLPAGVRSGSVIRMKQSSGGSEELVLIVKVASHPVLSIQPKGLVVEIPVSISEALFGASITLPTLDEPAVVKIPPGSQSGAEIRLKERGIKHKDGGRGDLVYRLMIRVPESNVAVGIKERADELEKYYEEPPRRHFPQSLLDFS
ncbi:MAG: DnaJ domain-containing protein [Deltaproteobacteria bacterium]|nr:DnaJ domain-containing protein [Deltaproteobacteria bacterium]